MAALPPEPPSGDEPPPPLDDRARRHRAIIGWVMAIFILAPLLGVLWVWFR